MDHAGPIPMVNEFGGMTPDSGFMGQPAGPPGNGPTAGNTGLNGSGGSEHMIHGGGGGPRGGSSPEFMNSGNFSEPQNIHNEQMVW